MISGDGATAASPLRFGRATCSIDHFGIIVKNCNGFQRSIRLFSFFEVQYHFQVVLSVLESQRLDNIRPHSGLSGPFECAKCHFLGSKKFWKKWRREKEKDPHYYYCSASHMTKLSKKVFWDEVL